MFCAFLNDILDNGRVEIIAALSLVISLSALIMTSYSTVENAVESRENLKNRLFCDYCARFTNDKSIQKVVEWLIVVKCMNSDKKRTDHRGKKRIPKCTIEVPTDFEKEKFLLFLTELNIQLKNNQLDNDDVRTIFQPYASLFFKSLQYESGYLYRNWNWKDFSKLCNKEAI